MGRKTCREVTLAAICLVGLGCVSTPDARYVYLARNPLNVFPSTVKLWRALYSVQGLQNPPNLDPWLDDYVLDMFARLTEDYEDPASVAVSREGIRLAFVAALQYLSARQRAVLIMRDVLQWPAAEVAELLGMTTTAVNSGLRRARAQLAEALPAEDELAEPAEHDRRALLDRFAAAFENADVNGLAQLLREDVTLEMPPLLTWFAGRADVARFFLAEVAA